MGHTHTLIVKNVSAGWNLENLSACVKKSESMEEEKVLSNQTWPLVSGI